jgi:hypothetical protein
MTSLGDLPGGPFDSIAIATNSDGSVIVGRGRSATNDRAVRWVNGTITQLPQVAGYDGGSTATGISPDGSVVFGYNTNNFIYAYTGVIGFRLEGESLIGLPDIAGGRLDTATGNGPTSRNGLIIPGRGVNDSNFYQACYWNGAVLAALPSLPGGGGYSEGYGVSDNGLVIVGVSRSGRSGQGGVQGEACVWNAGLPLGLGNISGGTFEGIAWAANADGSRVVGQSNVGDLPVAFIWDNAKGMRNLKQVLTDNYGLNLTGWTLTRAQAMTPDGRTIVGQGTNPEGNTEAWVARNPLLKSELGDTSHPIPPTLLCR